MANSRVASQAGSYKLESFKIRPINPLNLTEFAKIGDGVELSQIITQWSFSESMSMANITGSVTVFDAEGVIRTLPIIGEEYITIQWVDFYGDKQTKKFFCYGVEEVAPADDVAENILSYRLNFTSIEHLKAHQEDVRQSFADQLISDMVQSVFDTYYYSNDKTIEIQPTVGMQTYAIPSLTPAATMLFLARKAYGGEDSTNNFRFFETKDKFFFCTPEYLKNKYKDTIKTEKAIEDNNLLFFTNKSYDDNTPAGQLRAQQTVSGINYGSPVNTLNEISGGHYKTSMLEIDLLNHTVERTTTEFKKIITNNKIDDIKIPHSDKFLNEQMPIIDEVYALKDYPVQGQKRGVNRHYPFYREVINSKKLFNISMSKYSINCTIRGRNPLIPGMVIFLIVDLVEVGDKKTPDAERNGLYMVTDVTNLFLEDEFTQLVSLTKGGLSSSNDRSLFRGMR